MPSASPHIHPQSKRVEAKIVKILNPYKTPLTLTFVDMNIFTNECLYYSYGYGQT